MGMTVRELIEALKYCYPDSEVRVAYPSGDHWGPKITREVQGAEERVLAWTDYHQTYRAEDYRPALCETCDGCQTVLVDSESDSRERMECPDCNGTGLADGIEPKTSQCVVLI